MVVKCKRVYKSRHIRQGKAGTDSVHTHSLEGYGGKKVSSPFELPKGGLKKSPAWKLVVNRAGGKLSSLPPPEKRLGAPIKGGFPVAKWPVNVLVDPERSFWLPDDWGQGVKNTGTGGTYIGYISPKGKFFYHRAATSSNVETELGRNVTALDGFNGMLRRVQTLVKPGADKQFLAQMLTPAERKHVLPAEAFHFCIVSARRASDLESQHGLMLVEAHFRNMGVKPTWYVDKESLAAYRALSLKAIVGGKLTPARNMALDHAKAKGKICVQVSDDISMWEYYDIPQIRCKAAGFSKQNAAVLDAEKNGKVHTISPVGAAQFLLAKMRSHPAQPQLGGVLPQANPAMGVGAEVFVTRHFILGDFFVVDKSPCRFDTLLTLKEDYDFTASHLTEHGVVLRCNRMIVRVKHATNAGGAVSERDSAGAKERANIAILQKKWPGVFYANGKRSNEVVMKWSLGDDTEEVGGSTDAMHEVADLKTQLPKEFPPMARVQYVPSADHPVSYITKRCLHANGRTVAELLGGFRYTDEVRGGKAWNYKLSDLRYDVRSGRLKLVKAKASHTGKKSAGQVKALPKQVKKPQLKTHKK